jgi:hypothetical protein
MTDKTDRLPIKELGRMDFTIEVIHADDVTRTLTVQMRREPGDQITIGIRQRARSHDQAAGQGRRRFGAAF